jgi:hypothetical protein
VGIAAPKPLSDEEWIAQTEESLASDRARRDELEQRRITLRIAVEEERNARLLRDPSATGLPPSTTTEGQRQKSLAAAERQHRELCQLITAREQLLDQRKRQVFDAAKAEQGHAARRQFTIADDEMSAAVNALRPAWEKYVAAVEAVDRVSGTDTGVPVYRHLSRLLKDAFSAWPVEPAYLTRLDGLTDSAKIPLGSHMGSFAPKDGFSDSAGWGENL